MEKKLPPPSYTLELTASEQTVKVGATATFPIRVSGQNGYQQTVKLAVDKSTLPEGIEAAFDQDSLKLDDDAQIGNLSLQVIFAPTKESVQIKVTAKMVKIYNQLN